MLGRDACADSCEELSEIARSTCSEIFQIFVTNFSRAFYSDVVKPPTGEHLTKFMETYQRLGFPGCVGSLGCTHVKWSRCPEKIRFNCLGKEGYPSLSFQLLLLIIPILLLIEH